MAETEKNNSERLLKMLAEVGERVEAVREQALSIHKEKENILELLQDMQDHAVHDEMAEVEREDIESTMERLIFRCLTVEVSVSTPRDDTQEEAYKSVTGIMKDLHHKFQQDPKKHSSVVESYLNACLPEPVSSNIDTRFQSKLLGCTADDQKSFRQKLQSMHRDALRITLCNGDVKHEDSTASVCDDAHSSEDSKPTENKSKQKAKAES